MQEIVHLYVFSCAIIALISTSLYVVPAFDKADRFNIKNSLVNHKITSLITYNIAFMVLAPLLLLSFLYPRAYYATKKEYEKTIIKNEG